MRKHNQVDLLFYCLEYPKKLSLEFIRVYCEFPSIRALHTFANEYNICLKQNMKVIPINETPAFGSTKDYYRYKDELKKKEMDLEVKSHHYKLRRITKDLTI